MLGNQLGFLFLINMKMINIFIISTTLCWLDVSLKLLLWGDYIIAIQIIAYKVEHTFS